MPLEFSGLASRVDVESVLLRRGHLPTSYGQITRVLYPQERMLDVLSALGQEEFVKHFHPEPIAPYLRAFGKASFRKMMRTLVGARGAWVAEDKLRKSAGESLLEYVALLERLQVLQRREGEMRLTRPVDNIGPSLEHYVAQLCIRELRGSAEWGVTLEGLPRAGGDYDVLAWLDPSLVYIECKTAYLEQISEEELRHFLQRGAELAPDLAILLLDTDLDPRGFVEGKLNPILRGALGWTKPEGPIFAQQDYPGVFFGHRWVYVTTSHKAIVRQLRRCLQHYYARVRWQSFYSGDSPNFLTAPRQDQEGA